MSRHTLLAAAAAITVTLVSGAAPRDPELARVGPTSIRVSDFVAAWRDITPANRPKLETADERSEFLDNLVNRELMRHEAKRLNLAEDPYILLNSATRRNAVIQPLVENALVADLPAITDADVASMAARMDNRYHLHVLLTPDSARAVEARTWIDGGDSWAVVIDRWRNLDYGEYHDEDTENPEIIPFELRDLILPLEPGQWSPVGVLAGDYHLIYLESREPLHRDRASLLEGTRKMLRDDRRRRPVNHLLERYRAEQNYRVMQPEIRKIARRFREAAEPDTRPGSDLMRWPDVKEEEAGVSLAEWKDGRVTLKEFLLRLADFPADARPDLGSEHEVRSLVALFANERFREMEASKRGLLTATEEGRDLARMDERMVLRALLERVVQGATVNDDSVRAYYTANAAQINLPAEYHVAVLVASDSASAAAFAQRVTLGEPLEKLARSNSIHRKSGDQGGDLGWIGADQYPDLHDVLLTTGERNVGGPVPALGGWTLVHVLETRGTRPARYEEVQETLRGRLYIRSRDRLMKAWMAARKKAEGVSVYPERLAGIRLTEG